MAKKIDLSGAPFVKGARYPMPYDEPCAPEMSIFLAMAPPPEG